LGAFVFPGKIVAEKIPFVAGISHLVDIRLLPAGKCSKYSWLLCVNETVPRNAGLSAFNPEGCVDVL